MLKDIFAEFITSLRRKYAIFYMVGMVALVFIANIAVIAFRAIYGANEGTYAYNLMEYATWCFVIPYYTCILIADIAFNRKRADWHDSKNKPARVSPTRKFLTKLFAALLLGIVFVVFAAIILVAITSLFQITDEPVTWYAISDFIGKLLIACPLFFAGLSFGMMFLFMFNKKRNAFIAYFILTLLIPRVIMFFAAEPFSFEPAKFIRTYTITQNFSLLPYPADPARNVPLTIALGLIYGIIAIIIGCVCYSKKKKVESGSL